MNNEHLCTAAHYCRQNTSLIWKRDASARNPYVSTPQSKKPTTAGKTQMKTYPVVNNEHWHTRDTGKKHENPTTYGNKASQHPMLIAWQVNCANQKKVYVFRFNIK